VSADRPPRCRPLPPEVVAAVADAPRGTPDSVLLQRLEEALAALPSAEREALVTAYGYDEGLPGVALEQGLSAVEADSLTRSALQLLRAALVNAEETAAEPAQSTSAWNEQRAGSTGSPRRGGASYQG
jgi:DNA-directed RNA polymerase specialized sigma24 family protein